MFAKLVTVANNSYSANVFFNTIVGVITGSITANTQLDPTIFNQNASKIITTVAPGWQVVDDQANLVNYSTILPGRTPVVIAAPWTDSPTNYKYLWLTPYHNSNAVYNIVALPTESWSNTSKTFGVSGTIVSNVAVASNYSQNNVSFGANNSTFRRGWNDIISPMGTDLITNGTTTIISCSQSHLLVASYKNLLGAFNNYFFLSEYSRDDPWNTVGNGYPSWYCEGGSNTAGIVLNTQSGSPASLQAHGGAVARVYNVVGNFDNYFANTFMALSNTSATFSSNWGITPRFINYTGFSTTVEGVTRAFLPRGLAQSGIASFYLGNNNNARDINKNPAFAISELRLTPLNQYNTAVAGGISDANTVWLGGSISSKSPYVYFFKSQYQTFDEINFGGYDWMNLVLNAAAAGTTNASCVIVKEV